MSSPVEIWRNHKLIHKLLNKKGRLLVWTKVLNSPEGFESQTPYLVGIIELETKEKLPLQIVDTDEKSLKKGQRIITVLRKLKTPPPEGVIEYGIKAKPI